MGILTKLFRRGESAPVADEPPTADPIRFSGPAAYTIPLKGTGFGVVFEDDGETGYLYATDENVENVFDALLLYNAGTPDQLTIDDEIFLVWSASLLKAGIYYRDQFHAIVDFRNRRACCRSGFPKGENPWICDHEWNDELVRGLEP